MTLSKTKLIKVDRKFSITREAAEKAMLDAYAQLGIVLPEKKKKRKLSNPKTENI